MSPKLLVLCIASLSVASCATSNVSPSSPQHSYNYTEPSVIEINNDIVVNKGFDAVWDELVAGLATTFYVINNIDKESRLLNVSFSTSQPNEYVDCGVSERTFAWGAMNDSKSYKTAGASTYTMPGQGSPPYVWSFITVQRKPALEGRANVYVAPIDDGSTRISVNARYSWSVHLTLAEFHKNGVPIARNSENTDAIVFNTGQVGDGDEIKCVATGRFEEDILSIVAD